MREGDSFSERSNQALRECPVLAIAMICGYCMGGALGTATACGLRIASNDVRFGIPAAKRCVTEIRKDQGERGFALCQKMVDDCFASRNLIEGHMAFMEKRKLMFLGR